MAGYTAIREANETLLGVLREEIESLDAFDSLAPDSVVLSSPRDVQPKSEVRLSVFLYRVDKDGQLSNSSYQASGDTSRRDPPLGLRLKYMVTAYPPAADSAESTPVDEHTLLGLVLQIIHDNGLIEGSSLVGSLRDEGPLRISMMVDTDDELDRVWDAFGELPPRPSIVYDVGPILIDSAKQEKFTRVQEREIDIDRKRESDQ